MRLMVYRELLDFFATGRLQSHVGARTVIGIFLSIVTPMGSIAAS